MRKPHRALAAALALSPAAPALTHAKPAPPVKARKAPAKVPMRPYAEHTRAAEQRHGLPRHLIDAILHTESRGNRRAARWSATAPPCSGCRSPSRIGATPTGACSA
jgi:soluble lytic murein transglycosylase-like protein